MTIRLMSFNIHKGFSLFGQKFMLHELRSALRQIDVDVVLLQEVVGDNQRLRNQISSWPLASHFEFLADSVWPHYSYGRNAVFTYKDHGNAILSKFPIVKSENLNLTMHRFERRGLQHAEIELPDSGQILHVFNTHLDLLHFNRLRQLDKIVSRIAAHAGPSDAPLILAGDFNDWGGELTERLEVSLGLKESFITHTGIHAKSFPSFLPMMTLDRIYIRNMKVRLAQVLTGPPWNELSDHLPLHVELNF